MTIEERMNANLQDHGMHPQEEREAVIELAKAAVPRAAFNRNLSDVWVATAGHWPATTEALWAIVKETARAYLAEHNPGATYRSFFEE